MDSLVAVLLILLLEFYSPLIVSLNTHPDCVKFDFVDQCCINEEVHQLSITHSKQSLGSSGQNVAFSTESKPKKDKKNVTCYRCHQKGHYKNECKEELPVKEKKKTDTPAQEKGKAAAAVVVTADSECGMEW